MTEAEFKKLKQDNRKLRKYLKELSNAVSIHLHEIDTNFARDKTIPREASSKLARLANRLDLANDLVRHFVFDLSITAESKEKYVKKLISTKVLYGEKDVNNETKPLPEVL